MRTKIVEGTSPDGLYLKAAVAVFDQEEWQRPSLIAAQEGYRKSLLRQEGWTDRDFWILDLSRPGPGGKITMGATATDAVHALHKLPVQY